MMIRINLLPVRQVKKRELGRQVLVLFAAVFVLAGVLNYLWYDSRSSEEARRQAAIADTQKRIAEYEKTIGEVNNLKVRKKEVEDKLKILGDLRKGRSGPVRMLDALATATPKKVFLSDFDESKSLVKLSGIAASHEDVAEFMKGLGSVVWTPEGMGRIIEQKRDSKNSRIELLSAEGAVKDFQAAEIGSFFQNIELKKAEAVGTNSKQVKFEILLNANYAI